MKRTFLEHYYTVSIQKGEIGTLDQSDGLSAQEVHELEARVGYKSPDSLPRSPTAEEIDELFPVNISFFKLLSSGRFVYLHSNYTGKDNITNDRFGNYFSHSLILQDGQPDFKAASIFRKRDLFITKLSLKDDLSYRPKLAVADLLVDEETEVAQYKIFTQFINGHHNGTAIFSKILDYIVDGLVNERRILTICDEKDNLIRWMLSVNFFLPGKLSNLVSFASYVSKPSDATTKLVGITPECGINSLDPAFFILIDATVDVNYKAKHTYTNTLVQLINDQSNYAYELLVILNNGIEKLEMTEFNKQLNKPAGYVDFLRNIKEKTFQDYKNLISSEFSGDDEIELKQYIYRGNIDLYLELIMDEFLNSISIAASFDDRCKVFALTYAEYFTNNADFKHTYLFQLIDWFKDAVESNQKARSLTFALLQVDGAEFSGEWFTKAIAEINSSFAAGDNFDEKAVQAKKLFSKYNLNALSIELTSNLTRLISIEELNAVSLVTKFTSLGNHHYDTLFSLNHSIKIKIAIQALNNEFKKPSEWDFKSCIHLVKELFPGNEELLWFNFLEKNNNYNIQNNVQIHRLTSVRRRFTRYLYVLNPENTKLIKNVKLTDEEYSWVFFEIGDETTDTLIIDRFMRDNLKFEEKKELWRPSKNS